LSNDSSPKNSVRSSNDVDEERRRLPCAGLSLTMKFFQSNLLRKPQQAKIPNVKKASLSEERQAFCLASSGVGGRCWSSWWEGIIIMDQQRRIEQIANYIISTNKYIPLLLDVQHKPDDLDIIFDFNYATS